MLEVCADGGFPEGISGDVGKELECGRNHVAGVQGRVPVATGLDAAVAFHVLGFHPTDKSLGVVQVGGVVPLLGGHDQGEGGVDVCVRSRAVVGISALVVHVPVHACGRAAGVLFPVGPQLVKFALVVGLGARHVDHDHHAIGNAFGHRHFGTVVGADDSCGSVAHVFVPGAFPVVEMSLDDARVDIRCGVAILICHLLGEGVLRCCESLRCKERGDRCCS